MEQNNKIILFQEKAIRRIWYNEQWYFSIIDVIEILTENKRPSKYWNDLKKKIEKERESEFSEKIGKLKFKGSDGKMYPTDCATTKTILRIIMSIPSPKAEPFKLWLAEVGEERIEEIENPEIGIERIREIYRAKGYSEKWIETRLKTIDIRKELTEEWRQRGVKEGQEYSILTAEISKATFGLTPSAYKDLKGLDKQNLRDHMTDLELIFTMLGEAATRISAVRTDAQGFEENQGSALEGGGAAGTSLKAFEINMNVKVVSPENFLKQIDEAQKSNISPSPKEDSKGE